ncbi:MAG: right-handed parallel beta-helix repeat-containing protein, partial [Planctomycetota bacterium]
MTFLTTNWDTAQTVTVKAIDDSSAEGAHTSTITHTAVSNDNDYDGISIDDVVANVTDNDIAGVTIVESGGSTDVNEEGPTSDTYTVFLASDTYTVFLDTKPSDTVTITVDPDAETEVNNNGAGNSIDLTFLTTNWDTAQTVTVKAIDDGDVEGAHTSTITHSAASSDLDYDSISIDDVVANVTDNDFPPGQASGPSPADDANDVSMRADLSWTADPLALSHDVYFGTDFNDVNDANTATSGIFKGNQGSNIYDPGLLALGITYHWRIDEKNSVGTTKGNVWSFSTSIDTDADNIEDNWESQYGLDPNDANDADLDLDSDNYNNLSEYLHDSDPNDSNSVPSANITFNVPANVSTIQRAINAGIDGDTIAVSEGTYYESINFSGMAVSLTGTDPNDPNVVASTIIDANNTSLDVAVFNSGEDANSVLDGITLTGGRYGIYCVSASAPTVQRCVIRNNSSYGVYAYPASPTISDCEIRQNGSYGMYLRGAASVTRCRILSNTSLGINGYYYSGTIQNCVIAKNASYGIMFVNSASASVINCTIVSNASYGISGACAQVKNCIVWGNGNDLNACTATYSCIEDQDAGTGNLHALPLFVDADNDDYHLWYSSPCIDAGDPNSVYANEPNGGGGRIDIGAYGNTAEATTIVDEDSDGLADAWEETYWPGEDPNLHDPNDDPDADGLRNKDEYYVHWDPNSDDSASIDGLVCNSRMDVNLPSISLALTMAKNADTLILDPNTYYEVINFNGKPVHLRSTDPNDPNVVASTIIDANNTSLDVAVFNSGEDANSVIDGITLTGGRYGLYCTSSSVPTVQRCVIRNNSSYGVYAYSVSPTISDCEIRQNGSYGMYLRGAASVTRCRILSNTSIGIYGYYYSGTILNCVIAKNASYGIYFYYSSSASVISSTIVSNTTYGIYGACAQVKNCVVWGNTNDLHSCTATYSCIEDQDAGTGNLHALPLFVDADNDDYHLWYTSPCVDAGDPNSVYANEPNGGGGRIDIGAYGNTAEATTIVDEDSDGLADAWEETYWPGEDPNLHGPNDDPDGDGLRNKDEYYVHWDPNSDDSASIDGLVCNSRIDVNLPSISLALTMAENADTLILDPNTYYEVINFNNKPVHLRSTDPND